eukprot:CAMPEP_0116950732 /NCGR_PEP_ID=MMETSP0467-20121206/39653_1 /TAXON_ID=283647 /ORGANISM="Mesodinium pulex, Strain SPMC105" /LENGTH=119 /DNA_ID=CAMNT_0004635551 /DNA_START=118 /DNA_END=477 /DNA_ORIENTATION=+
MSITNDDKSLIPTVQHDRDQDPLRNHQRVSLPETEEMNKMNKHLTLEQFALLSFEQPKSQTSAPMTHANRHLDKHNTETATATADSRNSKEDNFQVVWGPFESIDSEKGEDLFSSITEV